MPSDLVIQYQHIATIFALLCLYLNLAVSLYGVFAKPNLVKKFIALTIFSDTCNIFAVFVGYRLWRETPPTVPVLINWNITDETLASFIGRSVDPLPQALVLTAIVIGLAVLTFIAVLIVLIHIHFGSVDMEYISKAKRGEMSYEKS